MEDALERAKEASRLWFQRAPHSDQRAITQLASGTPGCEQDDSGGHHGLCVLLPRSPRSQDSEFQNRKKEYLSHPAGRSGQSPIPAEAHKARFCTGPVP